MTHWTLEQSATFGSGGQLACAFTPASTFLCIGETHYIGTERLVGSGAFELQVLSKCGSCRGVLTSSLFSPVYLDFVHSILLYCSE